MDTLKNFLSSLPKPVQLGLCIALSIFVGIVDYFTGDYGITVVYFLPVYVSAKLLGERVCICFTILCGFELMGLALIFRPENSTLLDPVFWNATLQTTELVITGFLISKFTNKLKPLSPNE